MKEAALKYHKNGYSCSESIVAAGIEKGYVKKELLSAATSFSGGMGVRCLCGAIAGSQMVIGAMFGKSDSSDGMKARNLAKKFSENFALKYKANCCKVLSSGFEFHSPERREHCKQLIGFCAELVENIINEELSTQNKIQL